MSANQTAIDPLLDTLNEEQRRAAMHVHGPLLILAGAGSGKTRALTHRIAFLLQNGVKPWEILAVTFTNKAANEMKERIRRLLHILDDSEDTTGYQLDLKNTSKMPTMGTFHSICVRILRRDIEHLGRDRSFTIYDADDQEKLMKEVLKEMHVDEATLKPRPALSAVGRFKAEAVYPKEAATQATTDRMHTIVQAYSLYQQALRRSNALDFDDLILETVRLFHECPEVLEKYQETWKYLNVDEYQDTNHAQYLLISLLAKKYRNICVIGDPDQSIYGFRGADIRNILEFQNEYKDATEIKLERNYRSAQPVLTAADGVISANPNRPKKRMWTERKDGPKVIVHEVDDEKAEAEETVRGVTRLQREGLALRDQAIVYRTHAQSRVIEEACMRMGIPYRILGGVKFYARREVKDVLAYLHVLINPYDTVSLLRVINVPSRKIGEKSLTTLQDFAKEHNLPLWDALRSVDDATMLDEPAKKRMRMFVEIVDRNRARVASLPVRQLTESILHDIGMERWLRDGTEEGEQRWENVLELLSVMEKYEKHAPPQGLLNFLEEAALVSETDKLNEGKDSLTLMTLHLCKGLEYEHVTIVGCEEGIFPHSSSLFQKEQLEEERRIMYVGMTRAKTHLRLLFAKSRLLWGDRRQNAPSRFLDDLPDAVIERRSSDILSAFAWSARRGAEPDAHRKSDGADLSIEFNQDVEFLESPVMNNDLEVGARVEHPSFGQGTVIGRRGDVVDIQFDAGKKKTFALSIAPLKRI